MPVYQRDWLIQIWWFDKCFQSTSELGLCVFAFWSGVIEDAFIGGVFCFYPCFTVYPNMNLPCLKDSVYLYSQLHIPAELYSSGSVGYWVCHCWWEHSPDNSSQQASLPSTDWWLPGRLVSTCCLPSARVWELRACKTSSLMTVMGSLYRWKFRKRFNRWYCCDLRFRGLLFLLKRNWMKLLFSTASLLLWANFIFFLFQMLTYFQVYVRFKIIPISRKC